MPEQHTHLDADLAGSFLSLATEIRHALQQPSLTAAERRRIHDRAMEMAAARGTHRLRRAWPQLVQLGSHPAVIGGTAAAVLAVVGVVALRDRRGQGLPELTAA
jgi:hypothetical protein